MGFVAPNAPGAGIKWEPLKDMLLVIEPKGIKKDIATDYGMSDAVEANVYALTGPETSEDFVDTLIFPKILQSQTKGLIGEMICGRLTQGVAKGTQDPPWILAEATADDLAKAEAWDAARAKKPAFATAGSSSSSEGGGAKAPF